MKLHTVFITYNRLELTKRAISSYLETVTVPHYIWIFDNASTDGTQEWLLKEWNYTMSGFSCAPENRYPGFATNYGWGRMEAGTTHLHRADNDFEFLPGWCEEVERRFARNPRLGQLGLRTDAEDEYAKHNTGGNCVIRREVWDQGVRYDETPWPEIREKYGDGYSEDSFFSQAVKAKGWEWARVKKPCIRNLASGDWHDPYYVESYGIRGIRPRRDDPTVPNDWTGGYST